ERNNGTVAPATVNDYTYDQPATAVSQLSPTNVLGRLASASAPGSTIVMSYDGLGRLGARGFKDDDTYIEKHSYFDDGSEKRLELLLPDNGFKSEHVDYAYDSAGRTKSVKYADDTISQDLFTATAANGDI